MCMALQFEVCDAYEQVHFSESLGQIHPFRRCVLLSNLRIMMMMSYCYIYFQHRTKEDGVCEFCILFKTPLIQDESFNMNRYVYCVALSIVRFVCFVFYKIVRCGILPAIRLNEQRMTWTLVAGDNVDDIIQRMNDIIFIDKVLVEQFKAIYSALTE